MPRRAFCAFKGCLREVTAKTWAGILPLKEQKDLRGQ
jgi:hypothetical protein